MVLWVTEFNKIDDFSFVWFRDVMTSCHDVTETVQPISGYEFTRKMIVFRISIVFLVAHSRNASVHVFLGWYHVMTSRHDVTSILDITLQYWHTNLVVEPYWEYYTNSMLIWHISIKQIVDTIFQSCSQHDYNEASWRHDVTSCHRMKLKQY